MNMQLNPLFFEQLALPDQSIRAEISSDSQISFSHLFNHLANLPVSDPEVIKHEAEENLEWIDELTEQDVELLFNWFATKFDLIIDDQEQLINELKKLDQAAFENESEVIQLIVKDFQIEEVEAKQVEHPVIVPRPNVSLDSKDYRVYDDQRADVKLENQVNSESLSHLITQFDSFSQQDAKQLLDVFKQMQAAKVNVSTVLEALVDQDDKQTSVILAKVHANFEKKFTLAQKTSYQSDTTVTSRDVLKWIRAALEQSNHQKEQPPADTFGQAFSQHKTNSSIEQLQIQLGQQFETVDQMSEQLLSQFEKAISQSKFTQSISEGNQLLLKLTPKSLGTIQVQLTEIDGEMLVKLTASTQMAKEALEANSRELRHMFAPQNIVIEKQESQPIIFDQSSVYEQAQDEQEQNEQEQQHRQSDQTERGEESIRFEDVLFQERV